MKMRENVLKKVRMVEERKGIVYAKKGGYGYVRLRFLYTLAGIYTLVMHILLVLGLWTLGELKNFRLELTIMGVCTALIIAGYIAIRLRDDLIPHVNLDLVSGIVSILSESALIVLFSKMLEKDVIISKVFRFKKVYYYRHLIPLTLMILAIIGMTIIAIRAKLILKKRYKQVMENLYESYREKQGENFSETEWLAFLETYDPEKQKDLFDKKGTKKQKSVSEETEENERKIEKKRDSKE